MKIIRMRVAGSLACAIAMAAASSASASPISVNFFSGTDLGSANSAFYNAYNALTPGYIIEDFEDRSGFTGNLENGTAISAGGAGEIDTTVGTSVGTFTTAGGTGNGSTCASLSLSGNTCDNIGIQKAPTINGQGNTIPFSGEWALNTADTLGLIWEVNTGSLFNSLFFVLRDPADQGTRTLTIEAAGATYSKGFTTNESLLLVEVLFGANVSNATVTITTSRNDAFTFDGAGVNVVPLPAAGWMLLAGIGCLAALRRRQKA
jgi:hypothetical protein